MVLSLSKKWRNSGTDVYRLWVTSSTGASHEGRAGFAIRGAPRSKKNSPRVFNNGPMCRTCGKRGGFPKVLPSLAYEEWEAAALRECLVIAPKLRAAGVDLPIVHPVGIEALIYRDRNVGDLSNFLEAVGDMLQAAGIIKDDRQIEDWDGSRRR